MARPLLIREKSIFLMVPTEMHQPYTSGRTKNAIKLVHTHKWIYALSHSIDTITILRSLVETISLQMALQKDI